MRLQPADAESHADLCSTGGENVRFCFDYGPCPRAGTFPLEKFNLIVHIAGREVDVRSADVGDVEV